MIFTRTLSILVMTGLLMPGFNAIYLFSQTVLVLADTDMIKWMYYNMADKIDDEDQWRLVIESRLGTLKAEWENDQLKKIEERVKLRLKYDKDADEYLLRERYHRELDVVRANWESDAEAHKHNSYGRWLLNGVTIQWEKIDRQALADAITEANKKFLYETDDSGEYILNEFGYINIRELDQELVNDDFENWEQMVQNRISLDIQNFKAMLNNTFADIRTQLQGLNNRNFSLEELENYLKQEELYRLVKV